MPIESMIIVIAIVTAYSCFAGALLWATWQTTGSQRQESDS